MAHSPKAYRLLAPLLLLALAACDSGQDPVAPAPDEDAARLQLTGDRQSRGPDRLALSDEIPGFGGIFLDESGALTVYVTDPGQAGAAEAAAASFARRRGLDAARVALRRGDFSYEELHEWRSRARDDVFQHSGVVRFGLDESRNRVAVGVESADAVGAVRSVAARLGIPQEAIVVELAEPIHRMAALPASSQHTLRDEAAEIQGGYQIHFGDYLCTLGFVAESGGVPSFVTNSHCTNRQGGEEGTEFYQPISSVNPTVIGLEADDPDYFRKRGCPRGKRCRYSDAARVLQQAGTFGLGKIATVAGIGSIEVSGVAVIDAKAVDCPVLGTVVRKVGRTTGLTQGVVTATCVDVQVSGTNLMQLDQVMVDAGVGSGDSGAPVVSGPDGSARLEGILWGGTSSGESFVYSPMHNVERELGTLVVAGSGGPPPPPPPSGPEAAFSFSCGKGGFCSFDGSGSTGTAPLQFEWAGITDTGTATATHQFPGPVTDHQVTLTVTDTNGADSTTRTITCTQKGKNLRCR